MSQLIDYLPPFMRDLKEIEVIMNVEDALISKDEDNLNLQVKNVFKEQFISTATAEGIKHYEDMLKIVARTEDLEVRKFRVFIKFNEQLPYTITKLKEQIANLCGEDCYSATVDSVNYKLTVKVALKSKGMLSEVGTMLERIVPLNMIIDLDLMYNQHLTLHKFTHDKLHIYTHKALKDEVIS